MLTGLTEPPEVCAASFSPIFCYSGAGIYQFPVPFAIPAWLYAIGFLTLSFFGMASNNKGNIGHDAHLGGAIIGMLIAALLHPELARATGRFSSSC